MKKLNRTEIDATEVITIPQEEDNIEQQLREMTVEALIRRLNFEETDPKVVKLIKKIIKEKQKQEKE